MLIADCRKTLIGILILSCLTAASFGTERYSRYIGLYELSVSAPRIEQPTNNFTVYFYSDSPSYNVLLQYNKNLISANQMTFYADNQIELSGGFHSRYLNNEITGMFLAYNPGNNFMEGEDIIISTLDFYSYSDRLSFKGEKIALIKTTIGLPMYNFSLRSRQLDLYPGWGVFYDTTFNLGDTPFWYIPVYVVDKRRNAFDMPGAFPEWGKTYFAGDYARWNSHYYVSEKFYGNLQYGWALEKGMGYGMQNIIRISEYDQINYINENWQYWPTQERLSYQHSFLKLPYSEKNKLNFNELLQYNGEVAYANANVLRLSHTVQEESGVDLINRKFEAEYYADYILPWQSISLYTVNTYSDIYEITTDTEGSRWQSYTELGKDFEIPYIMTIHPGVGYDTVKYSLYPYSWHRVFNTLSGSRNLWIFRWHAKIYDYAEEKGSSPFSYDEHYSIGDNIRTVLEMRLWSLCLGNDVRVIIPGGRIHNLKYYLEYTTRPWTIRIEHDYTENSWWGGASASF